MGIARTKRVYAGVFLALVAPAWAQEKLEQPVALVIAGHETRLLRAGTNLPLNAAPGDILFAGDSLRSGPGGSAVFLFCPDKSAQELRESSEVEFEATQPRARKGSLANRRTTPFCLLPQLERVSVAAEKHYGASMDPAAANRPPAGPTGPQLDLLPEDRRGAVAAELAEIDRAIRAGPQDLGALVARAVTLERAGLNRDAAVQYRAILVRWPDAAWAASRAFAMDSQGRGINPAPRPQATLGGKTYALIVGISDYQNPGIDKLKFAHADAELFHQHLLSPRGGGLQRAAVTLLTNGDATLVRVRNAIDALLKFKAEKDDTIVLFFAAHGLTVGRDGYILTADSDPQNLETTALPMSLVQKLFYEKQAQVGRVVLYVDVCRAGMIGVIRQTNNIANVVKSMATEEEMFGILASRSNERAFEGEQWGGHGVFSLYLVQALNGAAKSNKGAVDAVSLAVWVQAQVIKATAEKQHPQEIGNAVDSMILVDLTKEGLDLEKLVKPVYASASSPDATPIIAAASNTKGAPTLVAAMERPLGRGTNEQSPGASPDDLESFERALSAGRILPGEDGSAFSYLPALERSLPRREYLTQENRLRLRLEDRAQQILLTYLKGEEVPQARADFNSGAELSAAAQRLTPESLLLGARRDFFRGRTALFDKDYGAGIPMLERAARADASAAYPYNALGIAYLASANHEDAALAFRDAIKRAPYWAYPRYNLALTLADSGDYSGAEREYREGIRLAPGYSFVHYGLGVLLHKLGRKNEAEREYQRAIQANPKRAEPYVGLAAVQASSARKAKAEENYRTAIGLDPALPAAAHDLGLLYAKEKKADLAIQTWADNVARNPAFIPSRMSLAMVYRGRQQYDAAIEQYQAALAKSPSYAAAAMALHETQGDRGQRDRQLDRARQEYQEALRIAAAADDRRRIQGKLKKIL